MLQKTSIRLRINLIALLAGFGLVPLVSLAVVQSGQAKRDDIAASTKALVESAHSIVLHFAAEEASRHMTRQEAQNAAKAAVRSMRYQANQYFWINDMQPAMVMHPFATDLEGKDLSEYKDPTGFKVFVAMAEQVRRGGEGFVEYKWPKPGTDTPQPKISFVKGFSPWGWVIGSGVYVDDVEASVRTTALRTGSIGLLVALLTIGCGALVAWSVTHAVGRISDRMTALANGDTDSSVPFSDMTNELGAIARSLETFRCGVIVKLRLQSEAASLHELAQGKLKETECAYQDAAANQTKVVIAMADGLERLAKGDLTFRLSRPFASEYEALRENFNLASAQLQRTMTMIAAGSKTISSGTARMSLAMAELSRRTEHQASSLQQVAATLDGLTTKVENTAAGTIDTNTIISAAKIDVERSRETVQNAVSAMTRIERSSNEIAQIISVIDEIAFQTNLLALNAGVEAARAGDAGRGFAVVASEVRALAQRSAEAAKRIKSLIAGSSSEVAIGVKLVDETGRSFAQILKHVSNIASVIADISSSASEQAIGLKEINTAVSEMDQVTQQNAAMVEETTAANHSLTNETECVAELITAFALGDDRHGGDATDAPLLEMSRPTGTYPRSGTVSRAA